MTKQYYSAAEAAAALGITRSTLYAYVSRGLIRSEEAGGDGRARRYRGEDVERLRTRLAQRTIPAAVTEQALEWGVPLLESSLTLIDEGRLYYRGRDVLELASSATLEEVAGLLWTGRLDAEPFAEPFTLSKRLRDLRGRFVGWRGIERMQALLIAAAAEDDVAYDLRPEGIQRTGTRILRLMASAATGGLPGRGEAARTLQRAWVPDDPEAVRLLNAALVLCADHELNVSAFTVRCVASAGSNAYAAVVAGLSAVQGIKHGGDTERVEAMLREVERPHHARRVLADRMRRGENIPGFGHRLYPAGDPRGRYLLERVAAARPDSEEVVLAAALGEAAEMLVNKRPTIDFGLVVLARALSLPDGAALAIFALGRAAGWIAHAIEQYENDRLIRPRARYVGRQPQP